MLKHRAPLVLALILGAILGWMLRPLPVAAVNLSPDGDRIGRALDTLADRLEKLQKTDGERITRSIDTVADRVERLQRADLKVACDCRNR
jgi:hypothetical protein